MKKFMKTAGWQIGAFVLAIGAAFATNAMKDTELFAIVPGYVKLNTEATMCFDPSVLCSTDPGLTCQWKDPLNVTHDLYGEITIEGLTKCVIELSRIN